MQRPHSEVHPCFMFGIFCYTDILNLKLSFLLVALFVQRQGSASLMLIALVRVVHLFASPSSNVLPI